MKKDFETLLSSSGFVGLVVFAAAKISGASFFAGLGIASALGLVAYSAIAYTMTGKFFPSGEDFEDKDKKSLSQKIEKSKTHQVSQESELEIPYQGKSETHFRDMVSGQKDSSNRYR